MKNLILKSVFFLSLVITLVSCKNDDDASEPTLIGKWEYTRETGPNGDLVNYEHAEGCSKDNVEFTNSTIISKIYENPTPNACNLSVYNATYTRNGNTLTIVDEFETYTETILTLTDTELKTQDGNFIYVYKRI